MAGSESPGFDANAVRVWRRARGWSQAEMAARLGCGQPTYSRYETGTREWPPAVARRLVALSGGALTLDAIYGAAEAGSGADGWPPEARFDAAGGAR